jgi:hypothetical protein
MKKMSNKASWRLFVILPIVLFAAGMIVMVTISMTRNVDLVTDNYYEQELKYQQQIDMKKNSIALDTNIMTDAVGNSVLIHAKNPYVFNGLSGEVIFYRPSDASKDFRVSFHPDGNGKQVVTHPSLTKGLWKIRLNLTGNGTLYAVDKSLFIN